MTLKTKITAPSRADVVKARRELAWMPLEDLRTAIDTAKPLLGIEDKVVDMVAEILRQESKVRNPRAAVRALMLLARHEARGGA